MTSKPAPIHLHPKTRQPLSTASIIRGKQANSLAARQTPVTLSPKPQWEKENHDDH